MKLSVSTAHFFPNLTGHCEHHMLKVYFQISNHLFPLGHIPSQEKQAEAPNMLYVRSSTPGIQSSRKLDMQVISFPLLLLLLQIVSYVFHHVVLKLWPTVSVHLWLINVTCFCPCNLPVIVHAVASSIIPVHISILIYYRVCQRKNRGCLRSLRRIWHLSYLWCAMDIYVFPYIWHGGEEKCWFILLL